MDKFLETYNLPKIIRENLDRQIAARGIEAVIKKDPNKQKLWTEWLHR